MKRIGMTMLMLIVASSAIAAPRGRRAHHPRMDGRAVTRTLELSGGQVDRVNALRASLRATVEPLRKEMRANRQAVKAAVDAGNAEKAGQLMIEGKDLRNRIQAARTSFASSFESILTPDQKTKWEVMREMRRNRRPGGR